VKASSPKQRLRIPFLLPVHHTRWQAIRVWLRQLWQRWRTPRIGIQPPLQPARHKPFPNRPHHRRRRAVFAALATAPPDATTHELMAHVRAVTGLGCSPKLIAAWKQENRRGDGQMGRKGDGQKKWMALQMRLFLFLLAGGCAWSVGHLARHVGAQEIVISPAPSASPTISHLPAPTSNPASPRLLRLKLTLYSPHELRVKAGDSVHAGDVISDHGTVRQRLLVQKRALQTATSHLQTQMRLTNESLRQLQSLGLELPPITFATERAAIQRAETEAVAVQRAVEIQRARVATFASLVSMDTDDLPSRNAKRETRNLITAHETAKLRQANDKQLLAHSELELHKAKLTTAQETRAWEEQKHRAETTRQRLSVRSQQQQAAIERARLTAQIAELDLQLAHLIEVRAPFTGTIKRIEWEDMNNETITVLVYLAVGN
jgi:biotin carboxyl carrier protein